MIHSHQFNQLADKTQKKQHAKYQPQTLAQWYAQAAPEVADVVLPIEPRNTAARDDVDLNEE